MDLFKIYCCSKFSVNSTQQWLSDNRKQAIDISGTITDKSTVLWCRSRNISIAPLRNVQTRIEFSTAFHIARNIFIYGSIRTFLYSVLGLKWVCKPMYGSRVWVLRDAVKNHPRKTHFVLPLKMFDWELQILLLVVKLPLPYSERYHMKKKFRFC